MSAESPAAKFRRRLSSINSGDGIVPPSPTTPTTPATAAPITVAAPTVLACSPPLEGAAESQHPGQGYTGMKEGERSPAVAVVHRASDNSAFDGRYRLGRRLGEGAFGQVSPRVKTPKRKEKGGLS